MSNRLLLSIIGLFLLPALPVTTSANTPAPTPAGPIYCHGQYAICASSTCTLTGGTIETKLVEGGVATYPEAECVCPVIKSKFQAYSAVLGQMQGSCAQPGKGQVWSIYTPSPRPQAMYNWSTAKGYDTLPLMQACVGSEANYSVVNCFGFPCTVSKSFKPPNGGRRVTLATCRCPVGSNTDGYPLPPGAPFQHEGGQCNSDYCSRLPVGIPYDGSAAAWQCLGLPPPLPPKKEVVG